MSNYEQSIYLTEPRAESHPEHLATIASLFGLEAPSLKSARVLELGSGTGGNLIPLAENYPESSFLGIDFSARQTEIGQEVIKRIGLRNIELRHASILDFKEDENKFDYIICHGVFSWVSKDIQEKILRICSDHLKENGLAYISYNTLPGWRRKQALREMMQFHTKTISDINEKVDQARALLGFLKSSQIDPYDSYSQFLQDSFEKLKKMPSFYIYHEYLEDDNVALYFSEFTDLLRKNNLRYLSDANFSLTTAVDLPSDTQELLTSLSEQEKKEQYLDFIRNREFRESIIFKTNKSTKYPDLNFNVSDFFVSAELTDTKETVLPDGRKLSVFGTSKGGKIESSNTLITEALKILRSFWPNQVRCKELFDKCVTATQSVSDSDSKKAFFEQIFLFYSANLLNLNRSQNVLFKKRDKPEASKLARSQALSGGSATSFFHKSVALEPIVAKILSLLDGSMNQTGIKNRIKLLIDRKELIIDGSADEFNDQALEIIVGRSIEFLARKGFLI